MSNDKLRLAIDHIRLIERQGWEGEDLLWPASTVLAAYQELNNAITWDTTCLNCSRLLDQLIVLHEVVADIKDLVIDDVDYDGSVHNNDLLQILHRLEN